MAEREVFQIVNAHVIDQAIEVFGHYRAIISSTDINHAVGCGLEVISIVVIG